METSLNEVTVDPETGNRNIDMITTKTKSDDKVDIIKKMLPRNRKELTDKLLTMGMGKEEVDKLIKKLMDSGLVYSPDGGNYLCAIPQRTL